MSAAINAKLKADQREDYEIMLESISEMVLAFIKRKDLRGVRRWASSLAHVGRVLLDDTAKKRSAVSPQPGVELIADR